MKKVGLLQLTFWSWLLPLFLFAQTPVCLPSTDEIFDGKYVRRLHFHQIPSAVERTRWAEAGLTLISWNSPSYTALIPASWTLEQLHGLRTDSITRLVPEEKFSTFLAPPSSSKGYQRVNVLIYPHYPAKIAQAVLQQYGAIRPDILHNECLRAEIPFGRMRDIAHHPCIRWIEPITAESAPEDTDGRAIQQSNALDSEYPTGRHYNGSGTGILIRDDGMVGPHIDFTGRLTNWATGANMPFNTHGDRVSGIAAGAGNVDPLQKGMATGAQLYVTEYDPFFDQATLQQCIDNNIGITNSSYSDGCNTGYSVAAREVDRQLADYPWLMHVFSAGNSNGTNCGYGAGNQWGNITGGNKMAKNSLIAGNIDQYELIASNSSRGPAYDGRVKPDICTYGSNQVSTGPDHSYQVFGGTSAAAPGLSGLFAQLAQAWEALHPQLPVPAALLKTVLLNTATDMGQPGPDFIYGWGKANGLKAVETLEQHRHDDFTLDHQQLWTRIITIPGGQQNARFMIGWTDFPAAVNATRALVNDLDLTVIGPDGTLFRPWILNHLPNANTLSAPAQPGRDSINNTEQISINNPIPGVYLVQVKGHSIPMGPQTGYMTWDYSKNDLRVSWPNGGESLVPGETLWLRWENALPELPVEIALSTDDGATYVPQVTLPPYSLPNTAWVVPQGLTGSARLRILQGTAEDISDHPFHIAPLPQAVAINRVCPDSITLSWQLHPDTLSTTIWTLGGQYMEPIGNTFLREYTLAHAAEVPLWASVSATSADGSIQGRRSTAFYWPGGLKQCPQAYDLALRSILWPDHHPITACTPQTIIPKVQINNEGTTTVVGAIITATVGTGTLISATLPAISAGDSLLFSFPDAFFISDNLTDTLIVTIQYPGDSYLPNNILRKPFTATVVPRTENVEATFEQWPIKDWIISNPDGATTWEPVANAVVGPWGNMTHVLGIEHYFYAESGAKDGLWLPPLRLSDMPAPVLRFHYAHAQYSPGTSETLRVELYPACDTTQPPIIIWEQNDPDLSTIESGSYFIPQQVSDWQTAMINLSPWKPVGSVRLKIVAINDYGNNTYIDNVGIDAAITAVINPTIDIAASVCQTDTLIVAVDTTGQWSFNRYEWNFGTHAHPITATGSGPHQVTYHQWGMQAIQLSTYTPIDTSTIAAVLQVDSLPNALYEVQLTGALSARFVPHDLHAQQYYWTFGDGSNSTDIQPEHTYITWGNYTTALHIQNTCGAAENSVHVGLSSSTPGHAQYATIRVSPNPANQYAIVTIPHDTDVACQVTDVGGLIWYNKQCHIGHEGYITLPVAAWPPGMYRIQVTGASGWATLPLIVIPAK